MLKNKSPFRLPAHIIPKEYTLLIESDLVSQTFTGTVTIDVNILKNTDKIYLHSKNLTITNAFIGVKRKKNEEDISFVPKIKEQKKDDVIILQIPKKIQGLWQVSISFSGLIHDDLRGFYISKYEHNKKPELIGATQFEAIDARKAFPCFDEPNMKAIFNMRLIVDDKYTAISNTEVIDKIDKIDNKTEYVFAPSPVMSTYLLAWTIGKFEKIKKAAKNGTMVNIYTPLGKKELGRFGLNVASKSLDFFEDYFKIPYPLNKLDLIALPDFASGAMENWGLITFRETCLLVDKNNTAFQNKQWVALIIAHEIAHQWFGNLVTMEWWDDLWLNEGFANYIEYSAIDSIFPEWKIWQEFTQNDMGSALSLDALKSSHPIEVPILDAHNIDEVFDDITYRKGASIIRMLAEYIGEKKFQKGISSYLKANAYKNATTKNLWYHLEKVSNKPVERIMGIWTKQAGFPVVSMEHNLDKIKCTQCRYFKNRQILNEKNDQYWPIPLDDGYKTYLLDAKKTNNIKVHKDAFSLNYKESNLIYIDYTKEFIEKQKIAIKTKQLNNIQKMGLIRNMKALNESGLAHTTELLDFIQLFRNEKSQLVIAQIYSSMLRIQHIFGKNIIIKNNLRKLYLDIFSDLWIYLNWDVKNNNDKIRSSIILNAGYKLGHETIVKESLNRFRDSTYDIPAHLRNGVYKIVVRYGNKNDNLKLWKKLEKEELHEEKMRIMASFAAVLKAKDILDVLDYYNSEKVKKQDTPMLIARLLNETNQPEIVYNYIEHHYGEFVDKYGKGGHLLNFLLGGLSNIHDINTLKHMKKFFKKFPTPGTQMELSQVYEKIESALLWQKSDEKELELYLNNIFS